MKILNYHENEIKKNMILGFLNYHKNEIKENIFLEFLIFETRLNICTHTITHISICVKYINK